MAAAARAIKHILDDIEAALLGARVAPVDIAATLARRYTLIGVQGIVRMAMAGIDIACWDALSLAAGMPLATFLGGAPKTIRAYNSNGLSWNADAVAHYRSEL